MISTSTGSRSARATKTYVASTKAYVASILLGLLFGFGAPSLYGAQADDGSDAGSTDAAETATSEATTDAPASEVFIPTEEISEDFAVSFPVDI